MARVIWQQYMASRSDEQNRERTGLPPLEQIKKEALRRALESLRTAAARARLQPEEPAAAR